MNINNLIIKPTKNTLLISGCLVMLASCVTINIYFPAAAAEKAAEKIVDEVWQIKDPTKVNDEPAPAKPEVK